MTRRLANLGLLDDEPPAIAPVPQSDAPPPPDEPTADELARRVDEDWLKRQRELATE